MKRFAALLRAFVTTPVSRRVTERDLYLADMTLAFSAGVCAAAVGFLFVSTFFWRASCS